MSSTQLLRVAVLGTLWVGSLFFVLPAIAIQLNDALGWPRWQHAALTVTGGCLVVGGVIVLMWATRIFRVEGGGSPVPTDPPTRLVTSGLYGHTRNPIFLADVVVLLGVFFLRGHAALLLYAGLVFAGLHAWLIGHEEPVLRVRLGEDWERYVARVPRWLGPARRLAG
jgi:protein-S-isoprenylcysteine O-methyltransferase Ste14